MNKYLRFIIRVIKNPFILFDLLCSRCDIKFFSDQTYLKLLYKGKMNRKLNLDHPQRFSEKLQWLKLYDRKPEYPLMADKYEVRKYVAEKLGDKKYLIPLISGAVWERADDIDFGILPEQFVLKCTHDSQSVIVCKNKADLNEEIVKKTFNKALKRNYYYEGRQWVYKNIKPRIIAEQFMGTEDGTDLKDYKFFCFNGIPKVIEVDYDRFTNHTRKYYDANWNELDIQNIYPKSDRTGDKPDHLEEMLDIAAKLSQDMYHARIDLYDIAGSVYFGEITFYHNAGFCKFTPDEVDIQWGEWLKLPCDK